MASSILQVRIDENLKNEASTIFYNLGLDMSSGIRLFLNRVVLEQGLPFPMTLHHEDENNVSTNIDNNSTNFDVIDYLENLR